MKKRGGVLSVHVTQLEDGTLKTTEAEVKLQEGDPGPDVASNQWAKMGTTPPTTPLMNSALPLR